MSPRGFVLAGVFYPGFFQPVSVGGTAAVAAGGGGKRRRLRCAAGHGFAYMGH